MSNENLFVKKVKRLFPIMFKGLTDSDCWKWGGRAAFTLKVDGKLLSSSLRRIAYVAFKGEIPEYHEVKMTCKNKDCVNPAHMETKLSLRQISASFDNEELADTEEVQS